MINVNPIKILIIFSLILCSCTSEPIKCDLVIYNGTIYDGSGENPFIGSVGLIGDKIVYVGENTVFDADTTIDGTGLAISPGFINMLSWGYGSLMDDGRSLSDIKQGVTLEVFGEGTSPGPYWNDGKYTTFGGAMKALENNGVSTNIASFLGAATVRILEVGYDNRSATENELIKMRDIVKQSMEEGAMGIGSSLIYAPGDYASTEELIELCKVASKNG